MTNETVRVCGLDLAKTTTSALMTSIIESAERGSGGWVVTINIDLLRISTLDSEALRLYNEADIRVADGMSLIWLSHLIGDALPERIAGSTISEPLICECYRRGWGVSLLGGTAGTAEAAAKVLQKQYPRLRIQADSSLIFSNPPTKEQVAKAIAQISEDDRLVLVGLGSPKQEALIAELRQLRPKAWMIGVGCSFNYMSGRFPRAPLTVQKMGLEWVHRLMYEPKRLARRYIIDDLPFFLHLMIPLMISRSGM